MSLVIDALLREHKTMNRLLQILEEQVDRVERADEPDYELIKEIIDYFVTYPDLCHHPRENLVLAKLKDRAPEAAAEVGALDDEHTRLSGELHGFAHAVANALLEVEIPRETLASLARDFIADERRHMKAEEERFFPAALRHLTEDDWREIIARSGRLKDPLSPGEAGIRFAELRQMMAL